MNRNKTDPDSRGSNDSLVSIRKEYSIGDSDRYIDNSTELFSWQLYSKTPKVARQ